MPLMDKIEVLLYNYFQATIEGIVAAYVFDRDGLLIAKRNVQTSEFASFEETTSSDLIYGAIAGVVENTLKRINAEYAGTFGTSTFETNEHRLNFIEAGPRAILLSVFSAETELGKVLPYIFLVAEKVAQLMDNSENEMTLSVPNLFLGYELELEPQMINAPPIQFDVHQEIQQSELQFKLCVIGDPAVGKTSLITQFVQNRFANDYKPTLGISVTTQSYDIQGFEQSSLHFMIWDVAGQKFFQRVRKYYYQGANVGFIVYDVTRRETFENQVEFWYNDIRTVIPNIPIVLIGNKIDLDSDRQVTHAEGKALAQKLRCSFMETSAKSGENVRDAFSIVGIGLFFKLQKKK